jgi:molybdate transport system regulatory protein
MAARNKVDALLALRRDGKLLLGRERIRLLEAVMAHGSISRAAQEAGLSYKTVWEAVTAINNLLPAPALITRAGGAEGGGAEITPAGRRLIAAFHQLEEHLARISSLISTEGLEETAADHLWALGVKFSTRNVFRAEVVKVVRARVDVTVVLRIAGDTPITALVTNAAADELELAPGRKVLVLVKAPFVQLLADTAARRATGNCFAATVLERRDGDGKSQVALDIGEGKTMTAVVPEAVAAGLDVAPGRKLIAAFEASQVILASS